MAGKKQAPREKRERRPFSRPMRYDPVSYTHLTLPTIA